MVVEINEFINSVEGEFGASRNADRSVEGYLYQFELTLLHILKNRDSAFEPIYKVESIEDYTKYFEDAGKLNVEVAQIKHHTSNVSKSTYYKAVLWMYHGFLKYKLLGNLNINYKVILYHSDEKTSEFKILDVLKDAIKSGARRKKPLQAYKEIMNLGNNSNAMMTEFSKCASFSKAKNRKEIIEEIVIELLKLYGDKIGEYGNRDLLYAFAISKVIDHSLGEKLPISFEKLDAYMHSEKPIVNEAFFVKRIEQKILDIITQEFEMLDSAMNPQEGFGDTAISLKTGKEYTEIYETIFSFISGKIVNSTYRRAFLNTVTTGEMLEFLSNTEQEYRLFLERGECIRSFIACLAKIMYQYKRTKNRKVTVRHLDKWFEINNFVWILNHPNEKRDGGYLIGDFKERNTVHKIIGGVFDRLEGVATKPSVWYWKSPMLGVNASERRYYKHDFMKVVSVDSPYEAGRDHFYIQCLGCMHMDDFEAIEKVKNIFELGCIERHGK